MLHTNLFVESQRLEVRGQGLGGNKRRQKNEGRRQKFTRLEEVLNPSQSLFPLKSEVLDRREKDEVNKPSALCPLPSALRAKPDNSNKIVFFFF